MVASLHDEYGFDSKVMTRNLIFEFQKKNKDFKITFWKYHSPKLSNQQSRKLCKFLKRRYF
ncbi:hypothetical protein HanIR_Chr17g0896291 [Helianthus annuus]|nr:hypothetical protein HanIR_Chr17g0896291 [Helianthus annuus]